MLTKVDPGGRRTIQSTGNSSANQTATRLPELALTMNYFLRELSRVDLQALNGWRNDREAQNWLVNPFRFVADEVDAKWYDAYLGARANNIRLMICESGARKPVGVVYLLSIDWIFRTCDFGILIGDRNEQGKGAGEFATRTILEYAFTDLNLHRVQLSVLAGNERARSLYRKVGFAEEGRARQAAFKNGAYVDLIQMAILAADYHQGELRVPQ